VWCGRSGLRGRTVRAWCRLSSLVSQAVCHTCRVLHKCCFIFYFCGHLLFLNGLWSPFLLRWWVLWMCVIEYLFRLLFLALFWDSVNPAGHHRGMEYFGSAILMAIISSILFVLADQPKIIGPSLSFCMTTSIVPILIMSFFVVLSVAAGICPPAGLVGL
jgi:branched-subunit amino acid transport protein